MAGKIPHVALMVASLAVMSMTSQLRIPSIPRISGANNASEEVQEPRQERPAQPAQRNRELEYEYRQEVGKLSYSINTSWSSPADNDRIDEAVAEYQRGFDRLTSEYYSQIPADFREASNMSLRAYYDTLADTVDREIAWAEGMITGIGVPDTAYNEMLVLQTALAGSVQLYPQESAFAEAKAKVDAVMQRFGSRQGANELREEVEIARAASVQMPAAITNDGQVESMFRTAWGTSGIPDTILRIHITSGWSVRTDALGRIVGRTRDAAIATRVSGSDRCNLYDFTMLVENGGNIRRSSHRTRRMACENIPG